MCIMYLYNICIYTLAGLSIHSKFPHHLHVVTSDLLHMLQLLPIDPTAADRIDPGLPGPSAQMHLER